jgi:hypothetical protein
LSSTALDGKGNGISIGACGFGGGHFLFAEPESATRASPAAVTASCTTKWLRSSFWYNQDTVAIRLILIHVRVDLDICISTFISTFISALIHTLIPVSL